MNLYDLTNRYQALLDYAQSVDMTDEDQAEELLQNNRKDYLIEAYEDGAINIQ